MLCLHVARLQKPCETLYHSSGKQPKILKMKNLIIGSAIAIVLFTACSNGNNNTASADKKESDTTQQGVTAPEVTTTNVNEPNATPVKELVSQYLKLKNALASDNGKNAATAGNGIVDAIGKVNKTGFTAGQKKVYDDVADDAKEMAEHISTNAGKIEHQREHFDMLSNDMYDLVKTFGAGQPLYKDFCPMYNNKKGAFWLSETKEIKNPYLGKSMPNCGSVKEELK